VKMLMMKAVRVWVVGATKERQRPVLSTYGSWGVGNGKESGIPPCRRHVNVSIDLDLLYNNVEARGFAWAVGGLATKNALQVVGVKQSYLCSTLRIDLQFFVIQRCMESYRQCSTLRKRCASLWQDDTLYTVIFNRRFPVQVTIQDQGLVSSFSRAVIDHGIYRNGRQGLDLQ